MSRQKTFKLEIVTPKGTIFSDNVVHVTAPGQNGRCGVLVNHISSITLLDMGRVDVQAVQGDRHFSINGGVAKVNNNIMKILTKVANDINESPPISSLKKGEAK